MILKRLKALEKKVADLEQKLEPNVNVKVGWDAKSIDELNSISNQIRKMTADMVGRRNSETTTPQ